jgi:RHS repeat-associated protein
VGALLFVRQIDLATDRSTLLAPTYDGNGNVTTYLDARTGSALAAYDYDAFGRVIMKDEAGLASTGAGEGGMPIQFSTKYTDAETALVYYGYRYFSPDMGRWLNNDPIQEKGGLNLLAFTGNNPVDWADKLGLRVAPDGQDIGCSGAGTGNSIGNPPRLFGQLRGSSRQARLQQPAKL